MADHKAEGKEREIKTASLLLSDADDYDESAIPDSLGDELAHLQQSMAFCDVRLLIGPSKRELWAHSVPLHIGSAFFAKALSSSKTFPHEVTVPDVDADIFPLFLQCIYSDEATESMSIETILPLQHLAIKLEAKRVVALCQQYLAENIRPRDALLLLSGLRKKQNKQEQNKAEQQQVLDAEDFLEMHIVNDPWSAFAGSELEQLDQELLQRFLRHPSLAAPEDYVLVTALRWCRAQTLKEGKEGKPPTIQQLMKGFLPFISWHLIPIDTLVQCYSDSDFIPAETMFSWLAYHTLPYDQSRPFAAPHAHSPLSSPAEYPLVKDIPPRVSIVPGFFIDSSTILTRRSEHEVLLRMLSPRSEYPLKRLGLKLRYRASRDGYSAERFRSKVAMASPTITVIKSNSRVFGGFTDVPWVHETSIVDQHDYYSEPAQVFLFSIRNSQGRPCKLIPRAGRGVVQLSRKCGPTFLGTVEDQTIALRLFGPESWATFASSHDAASSANQGHRLSLEEFGMLDPYFPLPDHTPRGLHELFLGPLQPHLHPGVLDQRLPPGERLPDHRFPAHVTGVHGETYCAFSPQEIEVFEVVAYERDPECPLTRPPAVLEEEAMGDRERMAAAAQHHHRGLDDWDRRELQRMATF